MPNPPQVMTRTFPPSFVPTVRPPESSRGAPPGRFRVRVRGRVRVRVRVRVIRVRVRVRIKDHEGVRVVRWP